MNNIIRIVLLCLICTTVEAQSLGEINIKVTRVSESVYMLEGRGGNIGLLAGKDNNLMIDDQFAQLSKTIKAYINGINSKPIYYLLNTHWHGDHTGGNANFAEQGSIIIAQDNVRERLVKAQREKEDFNDLSLPQLTFSNAMHLYFEGEEIHFLHFHHGHTDGDAMVYFVNNNVLHTGDLFFSGRYPYIDLNSGGSVDGYIKAVETALQIINEDTKIIPGHGSLSTYSDYVRFLEMLKELRNNVQKAIDSGKTQEAIIADESITQTYDDLGYGNGFINGERLRSIFYTSLKK
ncbi:MAG: MBL fold metallo-hydrolase [Flavobacteriaceae bacterium]|nr:MBL fold metallo-hydrolase [Flavobacteriaceae bacterium]